jgi:8-hydroxy-5-deazaflavin:NADPH oxidoreductase
MKLGVLGSGRVGGALAKVWALAGHQVVVGVRDPGSDTARNLHQQGVPNLRIASPEEAVAEAAAVLLATPFAAAEGVLKALGDLKGAVLIDATNALEPLPAPYTTAAEAVAAWAVGARIVKAFNSTGAENMQNPNYGGISIDAFVCGDDAKAKELVRGLAGEAGFSYVDVGGLAQAGLLEAVAKLWIHLAYGQGRGTQIAFKLLGR